VWPSKLQARGRGGPAARARLEACPQAAPVGREHVVGLDAHRLRRRRARGRVGVGVHVLVALRGAGPRGARLARRRVGRHGAAPRQRQRQRDLDVQQRAPVHGLHLAPDQRLRAARRPALGAALRGALSGCRTLSPRR